MSTLDIATYRYDIEVSQNKGTNKSSIYSTIFLINKHNLKKEKKHIFWGTTILGNPQMI